MRSTPALASIVLDVDPTLELGPLTLAWHGITIALGIVVGSVVARRYARGHGLATETLSSLAIVVVLAGMLGARALFLLETDPTALLAPGAWLGGRGFSFYGALVGAVSGLAIYLRARSLSIRYLDVVAVGFPLGMAVGRVGDVINGEHYGPATGLPWGVRLPHPEASVPSPLVAFHSGGLYEVVLGIVLFAIVWSSRARFQRPTMLAWTVIGLYAAARFVMFFYRSDSDGSALGLVFSQWVSVALLLVAAGAVAAVRGWSSFSPSTGREPTARSR